MLISNLFLTSKISENLLNILNNDFVLPNVSVAVNTNAAVQQECTEAYKLSQSMTDNFTALSKKEAERIRDLGIAFQNLDDFHAQKQRKEM